MALYLADSSIWGWADSGQRPDIAAKLAARLERDEVATCAPVVLEVLHRARTGDEYHYLFDGLFAALHWLPLPTAAGPRALEIQRDLAATTEGNHRRPATDLLVASAADLATERVTLWFCDRDLQVICEHTGQPFEAETASES